MIPSLCNYVVAGCDGTLRLIGELFLEDHFSLEVS